MSSTETDVHEPPQPAVADLADLADIDDEARALLLPGADLRANLEALGDGGFHLDAIRMLAHALPPRGAVWWGWGCAKQAAGDPPPDEVKVCLDATEAWLADPSDAHRRAAGKVGNETEDPTPASLAAMAVFLAEGSTGLEDQPATPPPPHVAAKLAGGAVCMAALADDPEAMKAMLERFFGQGMEVARKSGLWGEE